jgi:DNA mismatch endonuclease (patch repair protein)
MANKFPSYRGFTPASSRATAAAKGASRRSGNRPELRLRRALWQLGIRYRKNATSLPGRPDIVIPKAKVVIFCDGDFWHGRNWSTRKAALKNGYNASYWVPKIERNMERDAENETKLQAEGWTVLRFWESEIKNDLHSVVSSIIHSLHVDPPPQNC